MSVKKKNKKKQAEKQKQKKPHPIKMGVKPITYIRCSNKETKIILHIFILMVNLVTLFFKDIYQLIVNQ